MSLTFFVAALACPHCGSVSPADFTTGMSSHLLPDPGIVEIGVGHEVGARLRHWEAEYVKLADPEPDGQLRALESWSCPVCGRGSWAEVVVRDDRVESIRDTDLTRAVLDRAHFLTQAMWDEYEQLTGGPVPDDATTEEALARLRAALPEE